MINDVKIWGQKPKDYSFLKPFLEELKGMCIYENGQLTVTGDTYDLYQRHPLVKVGIRRALLAIKKEYEDAARKDQV